MQTVVKINKTGGLCSSQTVFSVGDSLCKLCHWIDLAARSVFSLSPFGIANDTDPCSCVYHRRFGYSERSSL